MFVLQALLGQTELTYMLSILSRLPELLGEGVMFGSGVVGRAVASCLGGGQGVTEEAWLAWAAREPVELVWLTTAYRYNERQFKFFFTSNYFFIFLLRSKNSFYENCVKRKLLLWNISITKILLYFLQILPILPIFLNTGFGSEILFGPLPSPFYQSIITLQNINIHTEHRGILIIIWIFSKMHYL